MIDKNLKIDLKDFEIIDTTLDYKNSTMCVVIRCKVEPSLREIMLGTIKED